MTLYHFSVFRVGTMAWHTAQVQETMGSLC